MHLPYFVFLADNHTLFRREIRKIIEDLPGVKVVREVASGRELHRCLEEFRPHLLILDVSLPNLRVMEATEGITKSNPGIKVLILIWDRDPEYFLRAISAGAAGCLLKQNVGTELALAINTIRQGGVYLPEKLTEKLTERFLCQFT